MIQLNIILTLIAIFIIIGGIRILISKKVKYTTSIFRGFFLGSIAHILGARDNEFYLQGWIKNVVAFVFIIVGLLILLTVVKNIIDL